MLRLHALFGKHTIQVLLPRTVTAAREEEHGKGDRISLYGGKSNIYGQSSVGKISVNS